MPIRMKSAIIMTPPVDLLFEFDAISYYQSRGCPSNTPHVGISQRLIDTPVKPSSSDDAYRRK